MFVIKMFEQNLYFSGMHKQLRKVMVLQTSSLKIGTNTSS